MPAKARWIRRLRRLRALGEQSTAAEVAQVLEISLRQAQRLTAKVPARILGNQRVMSTRAVEKALKGQADTLDNSHEIDRLEALREKIDQWNSDMSGPDRLPVVAPVNVVSTSIDGLPRGVSLRSGYIGIEVDGKVDAVQKLLALCFAIKNSEDAFESAIDKH